MRRGRLFEIAHFQSSSTNWRRIAALDSGFGRHLSRSSIEFGGEMLGFGLSNIAQQNIRTRTNMRVRRATSE
jgi:hypothetical protein